MCVKTNIFTVKGVSNAAKGEEEHALGKENNSIRVLKEKSSLERDKFLWLVLYGLEAKMKAKRKKRVLTQTNGFMIL